MKFTKQLHGSVENSQKARAQNRNGNVLGQNIHNFKTIFYILEVKLIFTMCTLLKGQCTLKKKKLYFLDVKKTHLCSFSRWLKNRKLKRQVFFWSHTSGLWISFFTEMWYKSDWEPNSPNFQANLNNNDFLLKLVSDETWPLNKWEYIT